MIRPGERLDQATGKTWQSKEYELIHIRPLQQAGAV